MRIVILDGYTCNPGDLSWDGIAAQGELQIYDRTPEGETLQRAAGADVLITNKTELPRTVLQALPDLRYVGLLSTGTNVVDLTAAAELGITVTNIPAYSTPSVAQTVFCLLLELTNRTGLHDRAVHEGAWANSADFCFTLSPLTELAGLTMGIVGFGQIGRAVARIAAAFGMRVLFYKRTPVQAPDAEYVALERLWRESDVISLHCPLTALTKHLIQEKTIAQMKPGAILINTGRGGLVDEAAVAQALNAGRLGGLGTDVLGEEPPQADNPLLRAKNCVITPHIAWASQAARRRLIAIAAGNLRAFLAGSPQNVVKPE